MTTNTTGPATAVHSHSHRTSMLTYDVTNGPLMVSTGTNAGIEFVPSTVTIEFRHTETNARDLVSIIVAGFAADGDGEERRYCRWAWWRFDQKAPELPEWVAVIVNDAAQRPVDWSMNKPITLPV